MYSLYDWQRIARMPLAPHAVRFPVQVAGITGEIAAWIFAPPAGALGPEPVVLHLYPGSFHEKRSWHCVPHPQDGSYSFAQAMAESYRCIVVACDHLGTGESTRPDNGWALTLEVLAQAQAQVADQVLTALALGTLLPQLPPVETVQFGAIGHGLGALVLHRVQARFQPYQRVAFLGWAHGAGHAADQEALAGVCIPNEQGYVDLTPEQRRGLRAFYYAPDVPLEVIETDERQGAALPGGMLADLFRPGSVQADAAQIDVPVFLGSGALESIDLEQERACYPQSPAVTPYTLRGAAHCLHLAPNRQDLWKAIGWWLLTPAAQGASPVGAAANHELASR